MKKLIIVGGAIGAAAVVLAKRRMLSAGGAEPRPRRAHRRGRAARRRRFDLEQWIERMPEDAPPKWIFNNITAIRENTERILQLLDSERTSGEG
jgi:hypothetical protein